MWKQLKLYLQEQNMSQQNISEMKFLKYYRFISKQQP